MAIVAVATMAVGSVLAITQTDVKRMLAYSSIAHAGFMMTAFVGASQAITGSKPGALTSVSSVMFYLVAYGAATIGAFALVTMVRDPSGEATLLTSWVGLGRRSSAGSDDLLDLHAELRRNPADQRFHRQVGGVRGGLEWRGSVAGRGRRGDQRGRGVLLHPGHRADVLLPSPRKMATSVVRPGWTTLAAVGVGVVATVAFGVFPGPLLALAQQAGEFIR